jgi:hypothetical protein
MGGALWRCRKVGVGHLRQGVGMPGAAGMNGVHEARLSTQASILLHREDDRRRLAAAGDLDWAALNLIKDLAQPFTGF